MAVRVHRCHIVSPGALAERRLKNRNCLSSGGGGLLGMERLIRKAWTLRHLGSVCFALTKRTLSL
jgi:hypothetical protein